MIFGFLKSPPLSPRLHRLKNSALFDTLSALELKIVRATLIYARRQRTWWNTDPSMHQRILPDALFEAERLAQLEAFVAGR